METNLTPEVSQSFNTLFLRLLLLRELRINCVADKIDNLNETFVLELINQYDGIMAATIAKLVGKTQSTIHDWVLQLAELGFIVREDELRYVPLHLTISGRKELERRRQKSTLHMLDFMIKGMKEDDAHNLQSLLGILHEQQNAQFEELKKESAPEFL